MVTVVTAVAALLVTGWSLRYTAEVTRATAGQLELGRRQQAADRFGRAVDQLGQEGAGKVGIRLGGIYALETLMHDSTQDAPTVIAVLCAFVRTHSPIPKTSPKVATPLSTDITAALEVLSRRPDPNRMRHQLDLNHAMLRGADLSFTYLGDANLIGAQLDGTDLTYANLSGAKLEAVDLRGADLPWASLSFADLSEASLAGATLSAARLANANLTDADLNGAYLGDSSLNRANLPYAKLRETILERADLRDADLRKADLRRANLQYADLRGADLEGADLRGADLTGAKVPDDLSGMTPYPTAS